MASSACPLLLLCFLFLLHPPSSNGNIHKTNTLLKSHPLTEQQTTAIAANAKPIDDTPPTTFFEVTKPINVPKTKPCISHVLQHDFGSTYGKPPVLANYTPPSNCLSQDFAKIVLEWKATCKGRQFDRIFGVWLGGVELLRSCTAEPRATGIVWTVQKDITRYQSLLLKNDTQELAVYIGNLVDSTYTGVYHVNVTIYYYPAEDKATNLTAWSSHKADLIVPFSRNLPLNDGLWFKIENSTASQLKEFKIPQNVYRAVLEVYVSFHENDEFWYGNYPDEYIIANNLNNTPGNGAFREVVVRVDGEIVGVTWPFTVIYTGGVNPLLWRPITAIGSFNLPSYDIELTPVLGSLLDGKAHRLEFAVTNGLNVWYVDANLHLWLDPKSTKTEGKLMHHNNKPLGFSLKSKFEGLNGTFLTNAHRSLTTSGWVNSSFGKIDTWFSQQLSYSNSMELGNGGNLQIVNQRVLNSEIVHFRKSISDGHQIKSNRNFKLYMHSDYLDQGNDTYLSVANVSLGFFERKYKSAEYGWTKRKLWNLQHGDGVIVVKDNLVSSGVGSTKQVYQYHGNKSCYFRNISSSNYTILYDKVGKSCNEKDAGSSFELRRWFGSSPQRASLTMQLLNKNGV